MEKSYWKKLTGQGPDRHIELLLALVIALFAVAQFVTSCRNNRATSRQSERLLDSANRIDDAADSFSKSSADVSSGVDNAVKTLQSQVQSMDEARIAADTSSRKALQATIGSFHLDQRAWLGFQKITFDGTHSIENGGSQAESITITVKDVHLTLVNTGKTPATVTAFDGEMIAGLEDPKLPGLGISHVHMMAGMTVADPPGVLITGQTANGTFEGITQSGTNALHPLVVVKANVHYVDIWKVPHITKLCVYRVSVMNNYLFCPTPGSNSEE